MPTITNVVGYIPFNAGPITTTVQLPASCTDSRSTFYAANIKDEGIGRTLLGMPSCTTADRSECSPYGDKIWEAFSKTDDHLLPYYFPALYCPSGWTTAGTTVYQGEASGVFTENLFPFPTDYPHGAFLPGGAAYAALLAPSETLIFCCPSGLKVHIDGYCSKSVGPVQSFTFSDMCEQRPIPTKSFPNPPTITSFHGSLWTPPLLSVLPQKTFLFTTTEPFETTAFPEPYIAEVEWALALVHKEVDKKSGKGDKKSEGSSSRSFRPTVFGAVSALPFAAAVATVLAGIFVL